MKTKIYVGSWYPRTSLHLDELKEFLERGSSHLSLIDAKKLKELFTALKPSHVLVSVINNRRILTAHFGEYLLECYENGLMLFSVDNISNADIDKSMKRLGDFAFNKVFAAFSYLFSVGAPIPKIFVALKSILPYTLILKEATEEEISGFCTKYKIKLEEKQANDDIQVYYGDTHILINGDESSAEALVREGIYYINDSENQCKKILDLHRFIWKEISAIKSSTVIRHRNLAGIRDLVMEIASEVIFFKSRLKQLEEGLREQAFRVESSMHTSNDQVWLSVSSRLKSVLVSLKYITNLWSMTEDYVSEASDLVAQVYQESSQKQINVLQYIFVISAVASIIFLGTITGFAITLFDNSGARVLSGSTVGFSLPDLLRFGGFAIGAGTILYVVINLIYKHFANSRLSNPKLLENDEFKKIKKMLN